MASFTANVLYLGDFADGIPNIDPNGTGSAEGATSFVGMVFTAASNQSVTVNDVDNNGNVHFDGGAGGENITYDLGEGAGPQTENVNQGVWFDIQIVLDDSTVLNTNASIFQTSGGKTFLTEFVASLDNLSIASIEVTGVNNMFFGAIGVNDITGTTVCFVEGTLIETPQGPRPVEDLVLGDLVSTAGKGSVPIVTLIRDQCRADRFAGPITFAAGAIGPDMPRKTLAVSPQHRVLCASALVMRMFGVPEILIPAKRFLDLPGVTQQTDEQPVNYVHLVLADHQILTANGAYVESCLIGDEVRKSLPRALQHSGKSSAPCLPVPKGARQRAFVERLRKKNKAIYDRPAPLHCSHSPEALPSLPEPRPPAF